MFLLSLSKHCIDSIKQIKKFLSAETDGGLCINVVKLLTIFFYCMGAQSEIQMLARFLRYSWLVCLLFFWLRNAPLVKVIGNPISDGSLLLTSPCLMRIIERVQKSLKRFWWPSGVSWLVSLSYYCIWCVSLPNVWAQTLAEQLPRHKMGIVISIMCDIDKWFRCFKLIA